MEYIKNEDVKSFNLGDYKIPRTWWSRVYEYAFAKTFLSKDVNVLDAGCGLVHPFKLYAKDKVKSIVAIDKDEAIKNAKDDIIEYRHQDIKDLNEKNKYDVVFCLGVLHHDKENLQANLKALKDSLVDDGIIVITFDTTLDINKFKSVVDTLGLEYHKEDKEKPLNAICGTVAKVNVVKTVLRKKEEKPKPVKVEERKTKVEKAPKKKVVTPKRIKKG